MSPFQDPPGNFAKMLYLSSHFLQFLPIYLCNIPGRLTYFMSVSLPSTRISVSSREEALVYTVTASKAAGSRKEASKEMHAWGSFSKCFLTSVTGSAGKSTCHQAWQPKVDLWNPRVGRRAPAPQRFWLLHVHCGLWPSIMGSHTGWNK